MIKNSPKFKQYPLVNRYFGQYLETLVEAQQRNPFEGRFVLLAYTPDDFEKRLARIDALGQTESIVKEVGDVTDPAELDRRLMDAWAEIRVLYQLFVESFQKITKVEQISDFTATCNEQNYTFQVKRIQSSLTDKVKRKYKTSDFDPYGKTIEQIHKDLDAPLGDFFWDALREKNGKFRSGKYKDWKRCIVIVSADEDLQDAMVRHIACQQIRSGIHDPGMGTIHFEYFLWLPDLSAGAWFSIGANPQETHCYADWKDSPGDPGWSREKPYRREVNLGSDIYGWLDPNCIYNICNKQWIPLSATPSA